MGRARGGAAGPEEAGRTLAAELALLDPAQAAERIGRYAAAAEGGAWARCRLVRNALERMAGPDGDARRVAAALDRWCATHRSRQRRRGSGGWLGSLRNTLEEASGLAARARRRRREAAAEAARRLAGAGASLARDGAEMEGNAQTLRGDMGRLARARAELAAAEEGCTRDDLARALAERAEGLAAQERASTAAVAALEALAQHNAGWIGLAEQAAEAGGSEAAIAAVAERIDIAQAEAPAADRRLQGMVRALRRGRGNEGGREGAGRR